MVTLVDLSMFHSRSCFRAGAAKLVVTILFARNIALKRHKHPFLQKIKHIYVKQCTPPMVFIGSKQSVGFNQGTISWMR